MHLSAFALFSAPYPSTTSSYVCPVLSLAGDGWTMGLRSIPTQLYAYLKGAQTKIYIWGVGSRMTSLWKGLSEIWRPAFDPEAVASACKKIKFLSIWIWFLWIPNHFYIGVDLNSSDSFRVVQLRSRLGIFGPICIHCDRFSLDIVTNSTRNIARLFMKERSLNWCFFFVYPSFSMLHGKNVRLSNCIFRFWWADS